MSGAQSSSEDLGSCFVQVLEERDGEKREAGRCGVGVLWDEPRNSFSVASSKAILLNTSSSLC